MFYRSILIDYGENWEPFRFLFYTNVLIILQFKIATQRVDKEIRTQQTKMA